MSTHKHIDAICAAIAALTLLVTVLFMNGEKLGVTVIASEESGNGMFTKNDLNAGWETAGATRIVLSDDGSAVDGNGAYVSGNAIYIVYAGEYVISGSLSDGQIIVEADGDDKIWMKLDGASVHCEEDAPIRVEQAGKVFLTLQEGTENALSSGAAYSAKAAQAGVDGVIYARDDLTINGGGSLAVTAEYRHGIVCNDDLALAGGTVTVDAPEDGIHANDSVRVRDCGLSVSAGDDGITVSNEDDTAFFYMESGNLSLPECYEGIEAASVQIAGGTIQITPTDDGVNASSYGGNALISITGGELTVVNPTGRDADGLDSNKDIRIDGGKVLISVANDGSSCALDYGSEYGGTCEISGGTVLACGSSGLAEGFDSSSSQGFLMMEASAEDGTEVAVRSLAGDELLRETVPCGFSSLIVSTPEMKVGDACVVTVGETETEMTIDNVSSSGSLGGFGKGMGPGGFGRGGIRTSELSRGNVSEGNASQGDASLEDNDLPDGQDTSTGAWGGDASQGNVSEGNASQGDASLEDSGLPGGQDASTGAWGGDASQGNVSEGNASQGDASLEDNDLPDGQDFGERPEDGNMRRPDGGNGGMGDFQNPNAANAAGSASSGITPDALLLVGISAIVLLAGCAIAFFYRRRG